MDVGLRRALRRGISDPRVYFMTVMIRSTFVKRLAPKLGALQRATFIAGLCLSSWPLFVSVESLWAQWSAERELASMSAKAAVPRTDRQEAIIPGKPGAAQSNGKPSG